MATQPSSSTRRPRARRSFRIGVEREAAFGAEELHDLGEQRKAIAHSRDRAANDPKDSDCSCRSEDSLMQRVDRRLRSMVLHGDPCDDGSIAAFSVSGRVGDKKIQRPDVSVQPGKVNACRSLRVNPQSFPPVSRLPRLGRRLFRPTTDGPEGVPTLGAHPIGRRHLRRGYEEERPASARGQCGTDSAQSTAATGFRRRGRPRRTKMVIRFRQGAGWWTAGISAAHAIASSLVILFPQWQQSRHRFKRTALENRGRVRAHNHALARLASLVQTSTTSSTSEVC